MAAIPGPDLLARFIALVGQSHALTHPLDQVPYLSEPRERYRGATPLVLRPGSVEEVAAILALAQDTGSAIVPQGGNTGLVGGQIPDETGAEIVLSLKRLDSIRNLDAAGGTIDVEAGVTLARVQEAAEAADRLFPLSLASEGSCTIGGNVATNAGGTAVIAYGTMRDLVLGLEVVLAGGRIWRGMRHLRKDNTGYDLRSLFIGSEGTLGVVTAAVLKLFPRPRSIATAFVGVPDPASALALLNAVRGAGGGTVTSFELMPRLGLDFVLRRVDAARDPLRDAHPWYVLVEVSSSAADGVGDALESVLAAAIDEGLAHDAVLAASLDQAKVLWRLREALSEVQRLEGGSIKHDIAVPVARVPHFIERASAAAKALIAECRPLPFGHLGDGNLHFNIMQPDGADKTAFLDRWDEVNAVVHAVVAEFGGSISAEHGIGRAKRGLLPGVKSPVEMDLMRTLKAMLDPKGILNPGKLV
jgi:FAD/FMN-containing dehydrogenase